MTTTAARPRGLLYPGEPETCRRRLMPFLRTMAFLGLLVELISVYRIEGRALLALNLIALAMLPLHYLAPFAWKKPLFLAASLVGLYWVFDTDASVFILGISVLLIGVTRLPLSWGTRVGILGGLGVVLALLRHPGIQSVIPAYAWPVLASMFMFRLILYMYELKHARETEPLIDTVGYFFLLPNYCFMHFPVVDYRTMQRGFMAEDVHELQFRGLGMMLRGTIHLIVYRLIDQDLLISAGEVRGPGSLAGFLVCNYLLYLQVSGQFHLACGMLHLFGYKLPETHHHYLLASGFTDYWRRINIYWKDFMVRFCFNPVVFRLKRRPQPVALAVATLSVFVLTWLLHAYQKYWLRGEWGFSVPDALFWGVLGLLVLVNVQLDARRARRGSRLSQASASTWGKAGPALCRGLKVAGTFATIVLLWSLWSSPSIAAWLDLLRRGLRGS